MKDSNSFLTLILLGFNGNWLLIHQAQKLPVFLERLGKNGIHLGSFKLHQIQFIFRAVCLCKLLPHSYEKTYCYIIQCVLLIVFKESNS